jgi:hypothetical protein
MTTGNPQASKKKSTLRLISQFFSSKIFITTQINGMQMFANTPRDFPLIRNALFKTHFFRMLIISSMFNQSNSNTNGRILISQRVEIHVKFTYQKNIKYCVISTESFFLIKKILKIFISKQ